MATSSHRHTWLSIFAAISLSAACGYHPPPTQNDYRAASQTSISQKNELRVVVATSRLNVRSGPGQGFDRVATVERGDVLRVVDQQNAWIRIRLANGNAASSGWVSGNYVAVATQANVLRAAHGLPSWGSATVIGFGEKRWIRSGTWLIEESPGWGVARSTSGRKEIVLWSSGVGRVLSIVGTIVSFQIIDGQFPEGAARWSGVNEFRTLDLATNRPASLFSFFNRADLQRQVNHYLEPPVNGPCGFRTENFDQKFAVVSYSEAAVVVRLGLPESCGAGDGERVDLRLEQRAPRTWAVALKEAERRGTLMEHLGAPVY